jgi:hypothetical protein
MRERIEKVKSRTPAVPTGYTGRKVQTMRGLTAADEAQLRLAYAKWLASVSDQLVMLFAAYALINAVDPSIKTVAGGVGRLCTESGRRTFLDSKKVETEIKRVLDAASAAVGEDTAKAELERIVGHLRSLPAPHRAVSGKAFLLPLLGFHLQSMDCRVRHKSLRMRLSTIGDPTRFSALASAVTSAAK